MSVPNLLPELISKPRKVLLKKKDDDSNYVPHDSDFGSDDEDYDDNISMKSIYLLKFNKKRS